ncbi:glutamine--tRNA ligase [Balamuthia mandrillaris]
MSSNNSAGEVLAKCFGFPKKKVEDLLKNEAYTQKLLDIAKEAGVTESGCDKVVGNLLAEVAAQYPDSALAHRPFVCHNIVKGDIANKIQLTEAFHFVKTVKGDIDESAFKAACGVGVVVTPAEIKQELETVMKEKEEELNDEAGGHWMKMDIFKIIKDNLKWGNASEIKKILDEVFLNKFGPPPKGKKPKPTKAASSSNESAGEKVKASEQKAAASQEPEEPEYPEWMRVDPADNIKGNPPEILKKHFEATGGRIVTRFPPEPNGYLHLGHSKAMNINFGFAKNWRPPSRPDAPEGRCYLRYDDTNPEKESEEYARSILDNVLWLGHTPYKVTHASDYFEELYQLAVELIKRGKAYVCHQTSEQVKEDRAHKKKTGKSRASPWRDRPIEESLKLFEDMRKGKLKEGEATLRMKQDIDSDNPCMWDMVAYRIRYTPHPRTGNQWCIYPSYDFTHCICDSLENITHSLCSLEFEVRRESYDWLLAALDIYRSPQIEYSRLNLTYTVMSKRKLIQLVEGRYVDGWDDPRLATLYGLRRRGYTPEAINNFCSRVGITKAFNWQDYEFLEECCRQDLEGRADREMVVLRPIKVVLTNYPEGKVEQLTVANHPSLAERGSRQIPFSNVLYIDANDFRMEDSANYYRLAPNKEVRLKYAYNITCTDVIKDEEGNIIELKATVDLENKNKTKGFVHWVARPAPGQEPEQLEVRMYDRLFKAKYPGGTKDENKKRKAEGLPPRNFLDDINPNSKTVITNAFGNASLKGSSRSLLSLSLPLSFLILECVFAYPFWF